MNTLTPALKEQFSIEKEWKLYLERVGLNEMTMHPDQNTETKRAFYGAYGQALIQISDEVAELEEDTGVEVLTHLIDQVTIFWMEEVRTGKR